MQTCYTSYTNISVWSPGEARVLDDGLKLGQLVLNLLDLGQLLLVLDHHDVAARVLGHVPEYHVMSY